MHRMLSQRNGRSDASKLRSASPQTTFSEVVSDRYQSQWPERTSLALKGLDDILYVYPLMGGYALQDDGRQPAFDPSMQGDGHALKPRI
jgi:hypothetical protein